MKFSGAISKLNGNDFAIIKVSSKVISNKLSIKKAQKAYSNFFENIPVILVCTYNGKTNFYGFESITKDLNDNYLKSLNFNVYSV